MSVWHFQFRIKSHFFTVSFSLQLSPVMNPLYSFYANNLQKPHYYLLALHRFTKLLRHFVILVDSSVKAKIIDLDYIVVKAV